MHGPYFVLNADTVYLMTFEMLVRLSQLKMSAFPVDPP